MTIVNSSFKEESEGECSHLPHFQHVERVLQSLLQLLALVECQHVHGWLAAHQAVCLHLQLGVFLLQVRELLGQ